MDQFPFISDSNYDWPAAPTIKPWAVQKAAANFMVCNPRCFNFSDMGSGKTLSTLWAADFLMRQGTIKRALIICPLSIMERVWGDAIFKNFFGKRTYEVIYGSAEKREAIIRNSEADFLIINFDGVGVGAKTRPQFVLGGVSRLLAESDDIQLVIIDEASAYRESRTKRHRIARSAIGNRSYLWLLTGTPTPNAPTDAYGLAKLVNNARGKSFTTFRLETMWRQGLFKWIPKEDGYKKARELLTPAIRFDISQVWDGPPITTQQRQVALTEEQKKLLAELRRHLVIQMKDGQTISAVHEAAARLKFMQISMGIVYDAAHGEHVADASPRLEELKAVLEECTRKIIIFAPLTSVVRWLYRRLDGWSREVVNGEVSAAARSRIFRDFQSGESPRILIADPGTMAHGLDLWAADTVLWYGPTDKVELYAQANKRVHRPGQKFPVTIVQLVSNALEREIFRRIENNLSMQGALLDAVVKGEF
jgi:SNF2 family DNA or RNA helicase